TSIPHPPPSTTLFPYTTLFRSKPVNECISSSKNGSHDPPPEPLYKNRTTLTSYGHSGCLHCCLDVLPSRFCSLSHIFSKNGCPLINLAHRSSCAGVHPYFTPSYNVLQTRSASIYPIDGYCFGSHSANQQRSSSK